jgi:hypothetical protein
MFKLKITHTTSYSEMGQPNPLRWRIMHKRGDTFYSQSGLIRCKDFFNDVVAWKKVKKEFNVYRFYNKIKFNVGGVYLHLTNISNKTQFNHNLAIVNAQLEKDLKVSLTTTPVSEGVVVLIPNKVWTSTYYISAVSLLIRGCNYNYLYKDWADFFSATAALRVVDGAAGGNTLDFLAKNGFKLPVKARKCWYLSGFGYNSLEKPTNVTPSVIHNNGVNDWVKNLYTIEGK